MANNKLLVYGVDIELSEKQIRAICDGQDLNASDGQKLANVAQSAMDDLGDGGMVLDGKIMAQIRNAVGDISEPQEIVRYVEAAKGMVDGKLLIPWAPDPTYVPVLEETAMRQGMTVDRVGQDLMDYAASQGWLYALAPDTVSIFMSREDFRMICEAFDKPHITGTDLAEFIRLMQAEGPSEEVVDEAEEEGEEEEEEDEDIPDATE